MRVLSPVYKQKIKNLINSEKSSQEKWCDVCEKKLSVNYPFRACGACLRVIELSLKNK